MKLNIFILDPKKHGQDVIGNMMSFIHGRIKAHKAEMYKDYQNKLANGMDRAKAKKELALDYRAAESLAWGYQQEFFKKNRMLLKQQFD